MTGAGKWHPSGAIRALPTILVSWLLFTAIGLTAIDMTCCGAPQGTGAGSGSAIATGSGSATSLGACSLASLEQLVGDVPLLTVVATDLASDNYLAAIAALVGQLGQSVVLCVVQAIDDFEVARAAALASAGSGSAAPKLDPREALVRARAEEVLAKYGAAKTAR